METKTTDELRHEIKAATNIEDFLAKNKGQMLTYSLPEHLNLLLSQKGVSRADVYQIFSGEKIPSRDKLIGYNHTFLGTVNQ